MRQWWKDLNHQVGNKGKFLLFLAALDYVYGWSLITAGPIVRSSQNLLLPYSVWGVAWIFVGVVCTIQAFMRKDRIAYSLAAFIKTVWGLLFIDIATTENMPRAWTAAIIWVTFAAIVLMVAGWPEPVEIVNIELPHFPNGYESLKEGDNDD